MQKVWISALLLLTITLNVDAQNDEIVEDTEAILILKTIGLNMISIESRVKSIHSYTNPCIISFKIEDGSKIYFDWIRSSIVQQGN